MTTALPEEIFDVEVSVPLIHQVVVAQQAAARQGTHKVKGRGERSGAGRKPFKQKGTGNARQGSIRMPQHRGGGIVHGPTPRSYAQRTPKKMIAAALRGVLSDRARHDLVHVVDSIVSGSTPSTKDALKAIDSNIQGNRTLVVIDREDEVSMASLRNVADLHVLFADQLNAYDVVVSDDIIFTQPALEAFVAQCNGEAKPSASEEPELPAVKTKKTRATARKAKAQNAPADLVEEKLEVVDADDADAEEKPQVAPIQADVEETTDVTDTVIEDEEK